MPQPAKSLGTASCSVVDTVVVDILIEELGRDTVALLLDSYRDETRAALDSLLDGVETVEQARLFHTLRGAALNLGMAEVAALSGRLEARAQRGDRVGEANMRLLDRLSRDAQAACREALDARRSYGGRTPAPFDHDH